MINPKILKLIECLNLNDARKSLDIITGILFQIIELSRHKEENQIEKADQDMIVQMLFIKLRSLDSAINGISYSHCNIQKLKNLIDPSVITILTRNLYETIGSHCLIYCAPQLDEQKDLIYKLWVIAGLKYRQRFTENTANLKRDFELDDLTLKSILEHEKKAKDEENQIIKLIESIHDSDYFQNLSPELQETVNYAIQKKKHLIKFSGDQISILNWNQLFDVMRMKQNLIANSYTYFSLYSHPSHYSIFQYRTMFGVVDGKAQNESTTLVMLRISFALSSFFIVDYLNSRPDMKTVLASISEFDFNLVMGYNLLFRER